MKTRNPQIDLFSTQELAEKQFKKETSAHLLKSGEVGRETFWIDRSKKALTDWPKLYTLISEK